MAVKPYCILDDRVWVKADSLPAKTSKYFDVYKQGSESSDIKATMEFGCDWTVETTFDTTNEWTVDNGSVSISNGRLVMNGNDFIRGKTAFGVGYSIFTKVYTTEQDGRLCGFIDSYSINNRICIQTNDYTYDGDYDKIDIFIETSGTNHETYQDWDDVRAWNTYRVDRISTSSCKFYQNDNVYTYNTSCPSVDLYPHLDVYNSSVESTLYAEYLFVTKCAAVEPVVITRDMGSFYRVYVYNDNDDVLTDFQFAIPASDLGVTAEESLEIYESPSDAALAYWPEGVSSGDRCFVKVPLLKANATHQYVLVKEDGYTPSIDDTMLTGVDWKYETEIDSSKVSASGTSVTLSDGAVHLSGTSVVYSVDTFAINGGYIFCTKAKADEQDIKFITCHVDDNNSFEVGNSDIVYPDDFDMLQIVYTNGGSQTISYDDDCESFVYTWAKYEIATHTSGSMDYKKLGTGTYSDTITHANVPTSGNAKLGYRVWNSSQESTLDVEFGYVRKYAATEPTVSVEDKGSYYLITVTENSGSDLEDYQIYFDATDIDLSSVTESLEITEVAYYPSNYWIEAVDGKTFFVVPEFLPWETQTWAVYKEEGYEPSISDTMIIGDTFGGTSFSSMWTVDNMSLDGNRIYGSSVNNSIYASLTNMPSKYILESRMAPNTVNGATDQSAITTYGDNNRTSQLYFPISDTDDAQYRDGSSLYDLVTAISTSSIYRYKNIIDTIADTVDYYLYDDSGTLLNSAIDIGYAYNDFTSDRVQIHSASSTKTCDMDIYYIFVRKYAAVEPTVVVTDMGTWWKVTITNNTPDTLTNYQVAIDSEDLSIGSTDESLMIVQMNHGVSNQPYKDLFEGCVRYYDFNDGNLQDIMGSGNTATDNSVTWINDMHGCVDCAFDTDGSSGYISIPDSSDVRGGQDISVIAVLNNAATIGVYKQYDAANKDWGIALNTGDDLLFRYEYDNGGEVTITATDAVSAGWNVVSFSYDHSETSLDMYANGSSVYSDTLASAIPATTAPIEIGYISYRSEWAGGYCAAILIFNRILSDYEHMLISRLLQLGYPYPIVNDTVGGLLE